MKSSALKKVLISVAAAIGIAAVLAAVFFAGYLTRGAVGDTSYDWALKIIRDNYYKDIDTENADEVAVDALVDEYLDIYSAYYTPEEYAALQSSNAGNKSGFGVSVTYLKGCLLYTSDAADD